jgi:hypothetical protein
VGIWVIPRREIKVEASRESHQTRPGVVTIAIIYPFFSMNNLSVPWGLGLVRTTEFLRTFAAKGRQAWQMAEKPVHVAKNERVG